MKELLERMVKSFVDKPQEVKINVVETGASYVIELRVAKEDLGKVIGKEGKMAWALRTLLTNASAKLRKKAILQILE